MMQINFWAIFSAAFLPLIIGWIWYHPKVFGTVWRREAGLAGFPVKNQMIGAYIFCVILSVLMAFFIQYTTVHQFGALGMVGGDEMNAENSYHAFMKDYGKAYRSFGHGAWHTFIAGFLFVFPMTAVNAMFEQKSWKYTMINSAYWTFTITLMGGLICGWYAYDGFYWVTQK